MKGHSKMLVKVCDGKEPMWKHFSYVPSDLVNAYEKDGAKLSDAIIRWAKSDTGVDISDSRSLRLAKSKIKALYKDKYPDMYLENDIDSQGWTRLWVIEHIKEELSNG